MGFGYLKYLMVFFLFWLDLSYKTLKIESFEIQFLISNHGSLIGFTKLFHWIFIVKFMISHLVQWLTDTFSVLMLEFNVRVVSIRLNVDIIIIIVLVFNLSFISFYENVDASFPIYFHNIALKLQAYTRNVTSVFVLTQTKCLQIFSESSGATSFRSRHLQCGHIPFK